MWAMFILTCIGVVCGNPRPFHHDELYMSRRLCNEVALYRFGTLSDNQALRCYRVRSLLMDGRF